MLGFGSLLLALTLAAAPPSLEDAQEAFDQHRYAEAETEALAWARPPHEGAAWYLVGLARFRLGQPGPALTALEAAGRAADAPARGRWDFNRGACLYELGRFGEARAAFLEAAAREPRSLGSLALVNAGFAALDGGDVPGARELAARARREASGAVLEMVAELEAKLAPSTPVDLKLAQAEEEYRQGLHDYDRGELARARAHFLRAAELDPADGKGLVMAGAAAIRLGRAQEARGELERALQVMPDGHDARIAREYLDVLSPGLASRTRGVSATVQVGTAYDSNVLQSGLLTTQERGPISSGEVDSFALTAHGSVAYRAKLVPSLTLELAYGLDQVAYLGSTAEDYSLQQHGLGVALELARGPWRAGLQVNGELLFTGLTDFRGLEGSAGGGLWGALDEGARTTTRVDLSAARKVALTDEFSYLTGNRFDARLTQELRLDRALLAIGYQFRDEALGTLSEDAQVPLPEGLCTGTTACSEVYSIPFGYLSHALELNARVALGSRVSLSLSAGIEWRRYLADNYLTVTQADGTTTTADRTRRRETRTFAGVAGNFRVWRQLWLTLTYEVLVSGSTLARPTTDLDLGACTAPGYTCSALDYDNKNYVKHVVSLQSSWAF